MNLFPAIEIRDVSFSYGKTPVLSHVNMSVRAGDFLAIIGPNGGGKSTLMNLSHFQEKLTTYYFLIYLMK